DGLRGVPGGADPLGEGWPHVHADRLDPSGPVLAELVEEGAERGGVSAGPAPHDFPADVVGDQGEVVVVLLPRDLVDADVDQAVETPRGPARRPRPVRRYARRCPGRCAGTGRSWSCPPWWPGTRPRPRSRGGTRTGAGQPAPPRSPPRRSGSPAGAARRGRSPPRHRSPGAATSRQPDTGRSATGYASHSAGSTVGF